MRRLSGGLAMMLLVGSLAGCVTTSHGEGSRAELYGSVEELAADSTLVVLVTATSEVETAREPQLSTGTRVVVVESLSPTGLPSGIPDVQASDTVTVWQFGDAASPGPLPLMRDGERYLLFLVATGVDKPAGYFITGSSAGYWVADGSEFRRPVDEGDTLPKTLRLDDLRSAVP
jgi:hypothetical protein